MKRLIKGTVLGVSALFLGAACASTKVTSAHGIGALVADNTVMHKGQIHERPDGEVRISALPDGESRQGLYRFSAGTVIFERDGILTQIGQKQLQTSVARCVEPLLSYRTAGTHLKLDFAVKKERVHNVHVTAENMERQGVTSCVEEALEKSPVMARLSDGRQHQGIRLIHRESGLLARR